jgi:preprotein translocase subunit SecD
MRRTRALWLSILFVVALVGGSVTAFVLGARPILGLDLEGGVSVILSAPAGTSDDVMDQALENIRNRVDAFGTAEPIMFVSGTNIEVQIPGLARGTLDERVRTQYCLLDDDGTSYGCFDDESEARGLLEGASVQPVVQRVCLAGGPYAGQEENVCFASEEQADQAIAAIEIRRQDGRPCLVGTGLPEDPCDFESRQDAEAALATIDKQVVNSYCAQGEDGANLRSDAGAACYPTEEEAQGKLAEIESTRVDRQFCVVSSAGRDLGCYFDREDARARLQETGQERLLQVIGQTARLEFREVQEELTPGSPTYDATPAICSTPAEAESPECSFEQLRGEDVVFLGQDGETKYRMGPIELTGDAITRAAAVFDSGGQGRVGQGWMIDFTLSGAGSSTFGELTTRLYNTGRPLAIVVDRSVISAPTVNEPITGGNGVITGSFTENRARDLATQLNAGALPVELTTEQVVTVSPTLGRESLDQGVLAGIAGLILLALYLLYYYRILAIVAWRWRCGPFWPSGWSRSPGVRSDTA